LNYFQETKKFSKGCNASFISLVPKNGNLISLDNFKPISLVGCVYKIISKGLTNRLKIVLSQVINSSQSNFLKERDILVANEVINGRRRKRIVVMKVDYQKAYDSMN